MHSSQACAEIVPSWWILLRFLAVVCSLDLPGVLHRFACRGLRGELLDSFGAVGKFASSGDIGYIFLCCEKSPV